MAKQYILPISQNESEYNPHDFIFTNCNNQLKIIIDNLPNSTGVNPYKNLMIVMGREKSGKTHFAHLFANKIGAKFISTSDDISNLEEEFFVIDDIDQWNEEKLFHLFNNLQANGKIALFTCKIDHEFRLEDLKSRINSLMKFSIEEPDDQMIKTLLVKHLADRSLSVSEDVVNFLSMRISRSFVSIFKCIRLIDTLSLRAKTQY
ncbi:MAG UNVERIFIED_CONTAM: hypothetical protein LVQ98_06910 [Rickettsiaceae bacterium]|jgi:chromosomal replication initiation ATPase DnaA